MGITRVTIKPGEEMPEELKREVEEAAKKPIVYDEDCPEYSYEELVAMAEKAKEKRAREKKIPVALRMTPETLRRAKTVGKGYTGFLSRLLDLAIMDKEMVQKALEMK
ncbi:MAG: hypothetical protein IJH57_03455 [Mogibacterium sp.]|nr:hypothetical protein [Mogibacterium sp.]